MGHRVRWGILGPGSIARKFATGLKSVDGAELAAVASRTKGSAEAFAAEFGVPRAHVGYENLAADPQVDVIYVATPHPMHADNAILCLNAGKAVLCEKPLTMNAAQAQQIIAAARATKVFCMEAMWTRFVPSTRRLQKLLADGAIGEVRMVMADFGYRSNYDPKSRQLAPALGGGGLLDVGCYPISLASMILGNPTSITGLADIGRTGVDEQSAAVLGYDDGRLAVIACAVLTETPGEASILGTKGRIRLEKGWWHGSRMVLTRGGKTEVIDEPSTGNGFNYEAEEVARCLAAGKTESQLMPLDESLQIMRTMDSLRAQWSLKYPME